MCYGNQLPVLYSCTSIVVLSCCISVPRCVVSVFFYKLRRTVHVFEYLVDLHDMCRSSTPSSRHRQRQRQTRRNADILRADRTVATWRHASVAKILTRLAGRPRNAQALDLKGSWLGDKTRAPTNLRIVVGNYRHPATATTGRPGPWWVGFKFR